MFIILYCLTIVIIKTELWNGINNSKYFNLIKSGTNNDLTDGSFAGKRRS